MRMLKSKEHWKNIGAEPSAGKTGSRLSRNRYSRTATSAVGTSAASSTASVTSLRGSGP